MTAYCVGCGRMVPQEVVDGCLANLPCEMADALLEKHLSIEISCPECIKSGTVLICKICLTPLEPLSKEAESEQLSEYRAKHGADPQPEEIAHICGECNKTLKAIELARRS